MFLKFLGILKKYDCNRTTDRLWPHCAVLFRNEYKFFFSSYDVIQKQFYFQISMNVNNLEITMATFALNPIQFVSIPLVPTNVSNQNLP